MIKEASAVGFDLFAKACAAFICINLCVSARISGRQNIANLILIHVRKMLDVE